MYVQASMFKVRIPYPAQASLEALGVLLDEDEARWEESYLALAAFMAKHDHSNVTEAGGKQGAKLACWCKEQRQVARHPLKTPVQLQQIVRLMELGFSFADDDSCHEG